MRAEIQTINLRGKPLPKGLRMSQGIFTGTLRIRENRLHDFGRVVTCATLTNPKDGLNTAILPDLIDAEIIWLADDGMRIRGIERVGDVFFAQTWDIKVLSAKG